MTDPQEPTAPGGPGDDLVGPQDGTTARPAFDLEAPLPPVRQKPQTEDDRRRMWRIASIVIAVLLVVVIAGGVVLAVRATGEDGTDDVVTTVAASDNFEVEQSDLAGSATPDGATWQVANGVFAVSEGTARILPSLASGNAIASLGIGQPTAEVRAQIESTQAGAGVIFRYVDEDNYWAVVAAPDFGTWNIVKRVDGKTSFPGNTGQSFSTSLTDISITMNGSKITVTTGKGRKTLADADLMQGNAAGLIGRTDDASTRWTEFSILGSE